MRSRSDSMRRYIAIASECLPAARTPAASSSRAPSVSACTGPTGPLGVGERALEDGDRGVVLAGRDQGVAKADARFHQVGVIAPEPYGLGVEQPLKPEGGVVRAPAAS